MYEFYLQFEVLDIVNVSVQIGNNDDTFNIFTNSKKLALFRTQSFER